jgi:hypothetical protein
MKGRTWLPVIAVFALLLLGRGIRAMEAWRFASGSWTREADGGPFADGTGWDDDPRYYATIHSGDIDGDGVDELLGRGILRGTIDVVGQFDSLQLHGDPMAFHLGVGDDPPDGVCRHYQGMARVNGPDGTPYIILTRSGTEGDWCLWTPGDYPGELLVVRMESRKDRDGERLRSNLLRPGEEMEDTVPPAEDLDVAHIHFNGLGWPPYSHPAGPRTRTRPACRSSATCWSSPWGINVRESTLGGMATVPCP